MEKAYIVERLSELMFCRIEALHEAEGTPIIEGTFRQTSDTWTGVFETPCGKSLLIEEGFVKEAHTA